MRVFFHYTIYFIHYLYSLGEKDRAEFGHSKRLKRIHYRIKKEGITAQKAVFFFTGLSPCRSRAG